MKRVFKTYYANKKAFSCGRLFLVIGLPLLIFSFYLSNLTDGDYSDIPPILILVFPVYLMILAIRFVLILLETIAFVFSTLCIVSGAVLLILSLPYIGRLREIKRIRSFNDGKLPGYLLSEMLQSGELTKSEYDREIYKNVTITLKQRALEDEKKRLDI